MDAHTFITKINDFSIRYKQWWYPAYEKFLEEYSKENPKSSYMKRLKAFNEFETSLRSQNDIKGEIFIFIDEYYDVYLNATPQECEEIRKAVTNCQYISPRGSLSRFFEDLFLQYVQQRAVPNLKGTGDKT